MNTPTKAGIALAVAALGWAGGTAYTGNRVMTELKDVGPFGKDGPAFVKVVDNKYEKTFTGAVRTMQIELGCPDGQTKPARVTWQDTISHGPLPGFKGVGAARIESKLILDDEARKAMKAAIGTDEFPFTMTTVVGFGGGTSTTVQSPGIRMNDAKTGMQLTLEPLEGKVDRSGDKVNVSYKINGYRVADKNGVQIDIQGITGSSKGQGNNWWALATEGDAKMTLMTMRMPQAGDKPAFQLKDLVLKQTGSISNELYTAETTMTGAGEAGGHKLDAVKVKATMKNMHAPSYVKMMESLFKPLSECKLPGQTAAAPAVAPDAAASEAAADPSVAAAAQAEAAQAASKEMLTSMMTGLQGMVVHNPEFSLDELSVTFEGSTAKLAYSVGTLGMTAADLQGGFSPALMNKVKVSAKAEVPVALLKSIAKIKNQPPEAVEAGLGQILASGYVSRDGDVLKANLVFDKGVAKVNGKPVPLPGMPPAAPEESASAPQ